MTLLLTVLLSLVLVACGKADTNTTDGQDRQPKSTTVISSEGKSELDTSSDSGNTSDRNKTDSTVVATSSISIDELDTDNLFSKRDLEQSPDLTDAVEITVSDGKTIDITEAGTYRITGTAANCTIRVDAGLQDKVQLVLDGVSITNEDFPTIYIVSVDKCFITTTNSDNILSVTGTFKADGDTNTDAVIFSREDLTLNGTGTLTVTSAKGNGISCKDDLKVTGGTYALTTALDALEANDSIAICDGNFTINTQKDALHSENDEDNSLGYIYISGGSFTITAKSDGIQATTFARFDGGSFKINASEGVEATYIEVNDGNFDIYGSDDGFNASKKSKSYGTPTVVINGGYVKIESGQGDTDAIDANGNIYVNGGTVDITYHGMDSFDYDGKAEFNGGTIYINGEQVDSIPQSMFGPGGGRGGWGGGNWGGSNFGGGNGQNPPDKSWGGRPGKGNGNGQNNDNNQGNNNQGKGNNQGRGGRSGQNNSDGNTDDGSDNNRVPDFNGQFPGFDGQRPDFNNGQFPGFNGQMPDFDNGQSSSPT